MGRRLAEGGRDRRWIGGQGSEADLCLSAFEGVGCGVLVTDSNTLWNDLVCSIHGAVGLDESGESRSTITGKLEELNSLSMKSEVLGEACSALGAGARASCRSKQAGRSVVGARNLASAIKLSECTDERPVAASRERAASPPFSYQPSPPFVSLSCAPTTP